MTQTTGPSDTTVHLSMGESADNSAYPVNRQASGADIGIIDWLKTNETVNMVMHKAKVTSVLTHL